MVSVEIPWNWLANREILNRYLKPGIARLRVDDEEQIVMGITYSTLITDSSACVKLDCCTMDELELRRIPVLEFEITRLQQRLKEAGLELKEV